MRDDRLWEKRCIPALKEMYTKARTVFPKEELPEDFEFSFDNIVKYSPVIDEKTGQRQFPFDAFYLSQEECSAIIKKAGSRLRTWYVFPYRSEYIYSDDEITNMRNKINELQEAKSNGVEVDEWSIKDLEKKIEYNDVHKERDVLWKEYKEKLIKLSDALSNKEITRKEYNKELMGLYKEYKCEKRGDYIKVWFTLWDYSPNSCEKFFEAASRHYNGAPFEYSGVDRIHNAVKIARAFVKNVNTNNRTDE